jgi:KaiC/GvpD/RAD55 family RecA-like ATPase
VYPYTDEAKAINAVCLFASSGLSKGESVILILADKRSEPVTSRLANRGLDIAALQASGQLKCISAEGMLRMLLSRDTLDGELGKDTLTRLITRAREESPVRKVRVFGEMVSFLLAQNRVEVAESVEELWNEVIGAEEISLLCSYTLLDSGYSVLPESLTMLHTHNLNDLD